MVVYGVVAGEGEVSGAAVVSAAGGLVASGAGAAVSVFCSHAARSAAPARMQMSLFIMSGLCRDIGSIAESWQGSFLALPKFFFGRQITQSA